MVSELSISSLRFSQPVWHTGHLQYTFGLVSRFSQEYCPRTSAWHVAHACIFLGRPCISHGEVDAYMETHVGCIYVADADLSQDRYAAWAHTQRHGKPPAWLVIPGANTPRFHLGYAELHARVALVMLDQRCLQACLQDVERAGNAAKVAVAWRLAKQAHELTL